jgi:hypothetical protein
MPKHPGLIEFLRNKRRDPPSKKGKGKPKEDFEKGTPMFGIGLKKIKRQRAKG